MDRRDFLLAFGLSGAGVGALDPPSARADINATTHQTPDGAQRRLTLAVEGAGGSGFMADQAHRLALGIERLAGDRVRIEVVEPQPDLPADLSLVGASALLETDPAFAFLTGLPGSLGLTPSELASWLSSGAQDVVDQVSARYSFKALLAGHSGPTVLWSTDSLTTAQDMAGLSLVSAGLSAKVVHALGALPVTRSGSVGTLRRAFELSLVDAISHGALKDASYAYDGITPSGHAHVLKIATAVWHRLTPAERAVIEGACALTYQEVVTESVTRDAMAGRVVAEFPVRQVSRLPDDIARSIDTVSRALVAEVAASSPSAHWLNAHCLAFQSRLRTVKNSSPEACA